MTDENLGAITCGIGACRRVVSSCNNGVPGVCSPGAPSAETCNGRDDDCDGLIDEGFGGGSGSRCRVRLVVPAI
jgi:hypothetical protein